MSDSVRLAVLPPSLPSSPLAITSGLSLAAMAAFSLSVDASLVTRAAISPRFKAGDSRGISLGFLGETNFAAVAPSFSLALTGVEDLSFAFLKTGEIPVDGGEIFSNFGSLSSSYSIKHRVVLHAMLQIVPPPPLV